MKKHLNNLERRLARRILDGESATHIANEEGLSLDVFLKTIEVMFQRLSRARPNEGRAHMAWSIPTRRERDALRAIGRQERGETGDVQVLDADACCEHGWAVRAPGGQQYRLTEAGRELLENPGPLRMNN